MGEQSCNGCLGCPSFMTEDREQLKAFGNALNAPVCGQTGAALGRPGSTQGETRAIGASFASTCGKQGEPMPVFFKKAPTTIVAERTPPAPLRTTEEVPPTNCSSCKYLVSADVVAQRFGWHLPMCSARGQLLWGKGMTSGEYAKDCPWGAVDNSAPVGAERADGLALLDVYRDAFSGASVQAGPYFIEPSTYKSDRAVTPAESAEGVRAIRVIKDPDAYGPDVEWPVFDPDSFDESERRLIPATDSETHPEAYQDSDGLAYQLAAEWMLLDRNPSVMGPAGAGKTELARHMAWLAQLPFVRINFHGNSTVDDLIGSWMLVDNETVFAEGRIPQWWERRCLLDLDELNMAPDEIGGFLRAPMDGDRTFSLDAAKTVGVDEHGRKRILTPLPKERHVYCFPMATVNPHYDPTYTGILPLSAASVDRMSHIWVDYPTEEVEREILANACARDGFKIDARLLDAVLSTSRELRDLVKAGTLPIAWGVRTNISVARSLRVYPFLKAYKRASADYHEPQLAQIILDVARRFDTSATTAPRPF